MIMPAKEEHGCGSGSESIDNHEPRDILRCHVERRDQSFSIGSIILSLYFTAFNVS